PHASTTAAACSGSTAPTDAAARARAASTSSIARSHAGSSTSAATGPRARTASNSPVSDPEEDGLIGSLQDEVEAVAVGGGLGDQRRTGEVVGQRPQHRVLGVRGCLVGEVAAGHDAVEQS